MVMSITLLRVQTMKIRMFLSNHGTLFGNEKEDLHTKETHICSGGNMSAIDKISLLDYVAVHEKQNKCIFSNKKTQMLEASFLLVWQKVLLNVQSQECSIRKEQSTKSVNVKSIFDNKQIQPCVQPTNFCRKPFFVNGKREFCNLRIDWTRFCQKYGPRLQFSWIDGL